MFGETDNASIPMWHWDPHLPPTDPLTKPLIPCNPRNPKFLFTQRRRGLTILDGPGRQQDRVINYIGVETCPQSTFKPCG